MAVQKSHFPQIQTPTDPSESDIRTGMLDFLAEELPPSHLSKKLWYKNTMLGQLNTQDKRATIVGAGISGLLAADALERAGYAVTLHETGRPGGLIRTLDHPRGPVEAAAHSIQATPAVQELCARLGVELVPVQNSARYIWRWASLRKFPLTIWETIKLIARAYFVLSRSPRATMAQWARRHLGEAPARYLITPMVRGIYGARAEDIAVDLAFPRMAVPAGHSLLSFALHRIRTRAPKPPRGRMMAPRHGMGSLTAALEKSLRSRVKFVTGAPELGSSDASGAGSSRLGNLLICTSAPDAAKLVPDAGLARALASVAYSPLVTITAFVEKVGFPAEPRGVGVLFPEGTSRRVLGILFNSSSFEGRVKDSETVSLTLMFAEAPGDDDGAAALVREELEAVFKLRPGARVEIVVHRWARAVPKYNEDLAGVWKIAQEGWCSVPGHILLGNYTGQVSIRGLITTCGSLGS